MSTQKTDTDWVNTWLSKIENPINISEHIPEDISEEDVLEILVNAGVVLTTFTENGQKVKDLLISDDIESVNQALVILETPNILDSLVTVFSNSNQPPTFFDIFGLSVPFDERSVFMDVYDFVFGETSKFKHRVPILEFLIQNCLSDLAWAKDIDAYIRIPWEKSETWPEREPLSKTYLHSLDGEIDDLFIKDLIRIRENNDGTFGLITNDFQIISCSAQVLSVICQKYPEQSVIIGFLRKKLNVFNQKLPSEIIYPLSLVFQKIATATTNRELLQLLVKTLPSKSENGGPSLYGDCHWIRESAVANEVFTLNELTALCEIQDRYILKGILQNPNSSTELQQKIQELLQDEDRYPVMTHKYIMSSNNATFGDTAYMGLDELVAYCLKVRGGCDTLVEELELPEGKRLEQGQWFIKGIQHTAWNDLRTQLGVFDDCKENEVERCEQSGVLLLESILYSDCEYDDEIVGSAYFLFELEYPIDTSKIQWHTDFRGKWGAEYDGKIYRAQAGYPDYQGGYATSLKMYKDNEWSELPSIVGTSWYYDFLLKGCDVDKNADKAHEAMKKWLLEKHPELQNAISSIHSNPTI